MKDIVRKVDNEFLSDDDEDEPLPQELEEEEEEEEQPPNRFSSHLLADR